MKSLKALNKLVAEILPGFSVEKGNGYFYFWKDGGCSPENINCVRISDVSEDMVRYKVRSFLEDCAALVR